jgi:hypothetical protein
MAYLEISRLMHAQIERVWDVLADFDGQAAWMADVRSLRIVSEQRSGIGTVVRVRSELFGLPVVRDVMTVTGWNPPYQMDVAHGGMFHGIGRFVLRRAGAGTMFVWIEDFRPPLGVAGEIGFALVVRPHLRRVFGRSLDALQAIVEAPQEAPHEAQRRVDGEPDADYNRG